MVMRARPWLPMWQRGSHGFKVDPVGFNMWRWRFLDLNGYEIEHSNLEFQSEAHALDHAADHWRAEKQRLIALSDARAKAASKAVRPSLEPPSRYPKAPEIKWR